MRRPSPRLTVCAILPSASGLLAATLLASCLAPGDGAPGGGGSFGDGDLGRVEASLSAAERRMRAAQIRDAAAANGITQGWLLAGIADAETQMAHCWSELTWACMGPTSPDCGGGPVVAGAGDGPCHLREGGLGMFQFDAGTFEDTLAREGDRVLSIAGNVAAAVDFVIGMVIRSTYVPGVSTEAEAIAWINGVRVDNARWDPWVRTVTTYYNGCRESYSCWSQRYAHYERHGRDVYGEMGADFWNTGGGEVADHYAAEFVSQSFPVAAEPFELYPTEEAYGEIVLRNAGTAAWMPGVTFLGTTEPRDGPSPLVASDWLNDHRAATVDRVVMPGETGSFDFHVRAPDEVGDYPQFFNLVQEGVTWFSDHGGPPDAQLQVRVTVIEAPTCPGYGPAWTCEGDERVRCRFGEVEREVCSDGCDASGGPAICAGMPPELGDPMYDGGRDLADPSGRGRGRDAAGGCAVGSASGSGPAPWLALAALGLARAARRRR